MRLTLTPRSIMRFLMSLIVCSLFALPANATVTARSFSTSHVGAAHSRHRGPAHTTHAGHHGHITYQPYYNPYRPRTYRPRTVTRYRTVYPRPAVNYHRVSRATGVVYFPYVEPLTIINPFFDPSLERK